jgi:protein-tyrosine-phosphatase
MAEALLKAKDIKNVEVRSAGIYAMDGGDISENTKLVIVEDGIDYSHYSRQLKEEDLLWADLILTMTFTHKQLLLDAFPFAENKTYTLKEYARPFGSQDVSDPFGGDVHMYRQTFTELKTLINNLADKLNE